jgi:hypothetical protein
MKTHKFSKRQLWMADVELAVNKARTLTRGKIDWDTATHFFNMGDSVETAAQKIIAAHDRDSEVQS